MAFEYYQDSHFIKVLEWMFYFTIPLTMCMLMICNVYELENIDYIHRQLSNARNEIQISKLTIFRLAVCYLMILPAFFLEDEFFVLIISGSILSPLLGFFIPVY